MINNALVFRGEASAIVRVCVWLQSLSASMLKVVRYSGVLGNGTKGAGT